MTSAIAPFGTLPNGMIGDVMSRKLLAAAGIPCLITELVETSD